MAEKKDLRALKIAMKAREFNNAHLCNEHLVSELLNAPLKPLNLEQKAQIAKLLNELIEGKNKAGLSK